MYDKVTYMGKKLIEWAELMANEYSLGELYQMMANKADFAALVKIAQ